MSTKVDQITFLLGAGCSYDAGIPTVNKMVEHIEKTLLNESKDWIELKALYHYIKSAIIYSDGIFGDFHNVVGIERLMVVLSELEKKERNVVYPFIANWNNRLTDLAGTNFDGINTLKQLITRQLREWIVLPNYRSASYYQHFYSFQAELGVPLRVFTLNYDLCFERVAPSETVLEVGFDEEGVWNSFRFDANNPNVEPGIYLYKLHGSIDWYRDKRTENVLYKSVHPAIEPELIFGTEAKLQSIDPYLFYVYELRKYLLDCRLVIVVGYSFGDTYINTLLEQALKQRPDRTLIVVDPSDEESLRVRIQSSLRLKDDSQIILHTKTAKVFLETDLTLDHLEHNIPKTEDEIF